MRNNSLKKESVKGWTVQNRLNLLVCILIFASAMAIVGGIQIYKGAKFHQYNFLHVKYNHQFHSEVDAFKAGQENISAIQSVIQKVQKQPLDCLDEATIVERSMMKLIDTDRAITLCENDIALGDRTLADLNNYKKGSITREKLIKILDNAMTGFFANSAEFSPLIAQTVSFMKNVMLGLMAFLASIFVILGFFVARSVSKDYDRSKEMQRALKKLNQDYLFIQKKLEEDIKKRKQLEEQRQTILADLEVTNRKLSQSNQNLNEFASIASHDLQEPLRKVIIFGDRLRDESTHLDGQSLDYITRMQKATARMQALIEGLLEYSRITVKARPFQLIDLNQIVNEVFIDLETPLEESKATVNIVSLPKLNADPLQMRQLFQNLIGNALKYYRKDTHPIINITSRASGSGHFKISVEDNGIGFDEKYKDKIFQPFQRLHGKSAYGGTGMGLAICNKIIKRHNGKIEVKSTLNEGTTFTLTLPQKPSNVD
ncbi:MAG: ATP-binding protein [Nitrospinales bacterium]